MRAGCKQVAASLGCVALLAGCVSFSDVGPEPIAREEANRANRVAHVRLSSSAYHFSGDRRKERELERQELADWPRHTKRALEESGWFREVVPYSRLANLEVAVDIREGSETNPFGFVSLLSLGLIPSTYQQELRIRLHIEASGRTSSPCEAKGSFRGTLWTLAFPFQFTHGAARVERKLLQQLVRHCIDEAADELGWS